MNHHIELIEVNQDQGMTPFSDTGVAVLKAMKQSGDIALGLIVLGIKDYPDDHDIPEFDEKKIDSVIDGFQKARGLVLEAITGAKPGQA